MVLQSNSLSKLSLGSLATFCVFHGNGSINEAYILLIGLNVAVVHTSGVARQLFFKNNHEYVARNW